MYTIGPGFVRQGERMRDIIFGFSDGVLTTLVIVAALTSANISPFLIIITSFANLVADGIATSLGGYISSKSQFEIYKRAVDWKRHEISKYPAHERKSLERILVRKGFKGRELKDAVRTLSSNKERWLHTMVEEELGITRESFNNPSKIGLSIFVTFVLAGIIPVLPLFFFGGQIALVSSLAMSFTGIFIIGAFRSKYTGKNWLKSALEMLIVGGLATIAAYFIGSLGLLPISS
jgi:VIT1/CCC1 family predicted Fe2+/Mn2+ transporter